MDDEVELRRIGLEDFKKVHYTRLNTHYKKPHELAKLILRHLGLFDFKNNRHHLLFHILFRCIKSLSAEFMARLKPST